MDPSVKDLLLKQQRRLLTELDTNPCVHEHPTDLGDATELNWIGVLQDFLPSRYQVAKARVLDSNNRMSQQLDIVVFDRQYCPLWLKGEGTSHYIPAESVYAVFEVKQDLNKGNLDYASKKIASVRRLHRTNAPIVHAGGEVREPKPPLEIIGGILAGRSRWQDPLGRNFEKAVTAEPKRRRLDIGCALLHGSFDVVRDPKTDEIVSIDRSQADVSLIFFLMRLFHRLQRLGTVPAIELDEYARKLEA